MITDTMAVHHVTYFPLKPLYGAMLRTYLSLWLIRRKYQAENGYWLACNASREQCSGCPLHSKKLSKHSPVSLVPTAFLLLPNFHLCFYNSIQKLLVFYFLTTKHLSLTKLQDHCIVLPRTIYHQTSILRHSKVLLKWQPPVATNKFQ